MAVQSADAEAGKDIGMHDVSLQRFSKVSWTEEEPTRPLRSIVGRTNSRRYDIATLMLIRATMNPGSVQLRINPAALTGMCLLSSMLKAGDVANGNEQRSSGHPINKPSSVEAGSGVGQILSPELSAPQ